MSWHYEPIFTFYRNPVFWLRSAWGHLQRQGWMPYPHQEIPWAHFVAQVIPYRSDDFEVFAARIVNRLPGIVTWLFKTYTPPKVIVHKLEDPSFLKAAGCDVTIPPIGTGGNLPKVPMHIYKQIQETEHEIFDTWYPDKKLK
jgi:hypothetical protein